MESAQEQSSDNNKPPFDKLKRCWQLKKMKEPKPINEGACTPAAGAPKPMQVYHDIAYARRKYYTLRIRIDVKHTTFDIIQLTNC